MINFNKVREDIMSSESEKATGIAVAALAQVIQQAVFMEQLNMEERETIARRVFGLPDLEKTDSE